ncbi:50S ribosomal protein L4 [miscellaneous Crenarchaeota group-15 archaeon DG-45]|uniref:50S ribosomal protein L4 n=1 Tax=miscellaneous Crenarchaeota group-15 archaeon DG-45 TaxID=1685127 RepID=A0A0M0BS33_9ARCH|nr:MAG: 50S ribosomal protein L4 [miscellaneous Crenarchaeota group-15 archaeon DG-45]
MPRVFQTPYRPDVIKRAVIAQQSHGFQPQGRDPRAGKRTTAESRGVGLGIARVPRIKGGNRAAFGVSIVGGHQAFPPRAEKRIRKGINRKERRLAIKSGIAATANREIVAGRGHAIDAVGQLPLVVEDAVQSLTQTGEVRDLFVSLGLWPDVERAKNRKMRAGRGKTRGRRRRVGKGPLVVVAEDRGIGKAGANLPGVEVAEVGDLSAELLAPGAHPGRLVLWTRSAFAALDEVWGERR